MGAKAPDIKVRRGSFKCDVCGRKFLNVQALTSHRKFLHKTKAVPTKKVLIRKAPALPMAKTAKKKVSAAPVVKKASPMPPPKVAPKSRVKPSNEVSVDKKETSSKQIQFKCPKCMKYFNVYFSAYRHIQKNHCVDNNDRPVDPSSPNLIQPIRLELCTLCDKVYDAADKKHTCVNIDLQSERYMCLGCQKTFENLTLFEQHVKVSHLTELDTLYFPTRIDLIAWKAELESVTKIKYITLTTSKQKSKEMYHCSHQPSIEMNKILMCPSSLTVMEFKTGYHVHYYKQHFGHTCSDILPLKYKKYSISPYLKDTDTLEFQQFKSIINDVAEKAVKVDTKTLLNLLEKALDMNFILNTALPHDETSVTKKNMTDNQITEVLSEIKTYPGKRKADLAKKETKKAKPNLENNENSSLNKPILLPSPVKAPVKPFLQSPSFNDTYKHFVDQNFKNSLPDSSTAKKGTVKKKVVMKTLIGQFKGRKNTSPKSAVVTESPVQKVKPNMSPKTPKEEKPAPKTPIPTFSPKLQLEYKIKADIKYEVKEQENDCNILILKI